MMQGETLFLEEWLRDQITAGTTRTAVGPGNRPTLSSQQPFTARLVLQSWTDLRNNRRVIDSLQTLVESQSTLHVADPQAKLLLSFFSSAPPPHSTPLLYRLIYIWVRKTHRASLPLLDSSVKILSSSTTNSFPDQILLLGAIAAVPGLSEDSTRVCLDRLCHSIEDVRVAIGSSPELVFAGIGYALSRSSTLYFTKILSLLLGIWSGERGADSTLRHGIMLLGLVEWLVMGLINSRSLEKIDILCTSVSVEKLRSGNYPRFAVAMSSAGVLRAFRRFGPSNRLELNPKAKHMIEGSISHVAHYVVSRLGSDYRLNDDDHESHLLVQCISLGLARCGPYPADAAVLRCICLALLNDVFPLSLFVEIANNPGVVGLNKAREYMDGVLFREAGAISGVLCNQYTSAVTESMSIVEDFMWAFSHEFYIKLQTALSVLLQGNKEEVIVKEVEKMAESIFLMVVVFASAVAKRKLDEKSPDTMKPEVAAKVLVAFSCIEYLRRMRWPQYTDVVRRAVLILQENASTSTLYVDSMPSYDELTNGVVGSHLPEGLQYIWSEDGVQTARVLFYLRVIPTCIVHISSPVFRRKVAPIMFLYMCHPNLKVSQASHSVFVAFISFGEDSSQNDDNLKEQLVFYYIHRALEVYPELTPYKGMVAGVSALVRHLPAGSPAIFYCINSLVEKAASLFRLAIKEDSYLWKNWEGDSEPCKKVLELLLHLVTLVDIQVLPNMLKLLAQFIIKLPEEGHKIVLDEIYSLVAESDDVTRKPTLVSWLHSLSYISSQTRSQNSLKESFSRL